MTVRIRTALIAALLCVGLLPMAAMLVSTYMQSVKWEYQEAESLQSMLAANLSQSLSRYEDTVRATVDVLAGALEAGRSGDDKLPLLIALGIESVSLVDGKTGEVLVSAGRLQRAPGSFYPASDMERFDRSVEYRHWAFEPVRGQLAGPVIDLVRRGNDNLIVAEISTHYFNEVARKISFGRQGYATIVDQAGHVLAHPNPGWVRSAYDLSGVRAVQDLKSVGTGIVEFESPAFNTSMIAALATVPNTGWGILVSQPVADVQAAIDDGMQPILFWLGVGLAGAIGLISLFLRWLASPLEVLSDSLHEQSRIGRPASVPPDRVRNMVVELRGIVDAYNDLAITVERNADEMAERAYRDTVTEIGNRAYFISGAEKQIAARLPVKQRGVLIFIDLDNFKEINDVRGHDVGDGFLEQFAKSLYPTTKRFMDRKFRGVTAAYPIIGRIGGDEFAILLPLPEEAGNIAELCEELRRSLPQNLLIRDLELPCQTSAGGAIYPDHGSQVEDLMRRADVALYHAKAKGKHRFELYNQDNILGGKREILSAFVHALENDELALEYQPKFCIRKRRITGAEALLRWHHADYGTVPPSLFLGAIQKTSVMNRLGHWVIDRCLRDMRTLDALGHDLTVAVNIGAEHFTANNFVPKLRRQLSEYRFDPARLQIEITEDVMAMSAETYRETVASVQKLGCTVAVDDFGSGFSNLSRLASVPVDVVKLDRSMIWDAMSNQRLAIIMKSAIALAHSLGSRVVVEGVETLEQLTLATNSDADAVQGFYFSRSLPPDELSNWIKQRQSVIPHKQRKEIEQRMSA